MEIKEECSLESADNKHIENYLVRSNYETKLNDIYKCRFISRRENLVLLGLPGTGKTHFSIVLGLKSVKMGYTTLFTTFLDMVQDLTEAASKEEYEAKMEKYTNPQLLILDEAGSKRFSNIDNSIVNQVITRRYNKLSTVIVSPRKVDGWEKALKEGNVSKAVPECFLRDCSIVEVSRD